MMRATRPPSAALRRARPQSGAGDGGQALWRGREFEAGAPACAAAAAADGCAEDEGRGAMGRATAEGRAAAAGVHAAAEMLARQRRPQQPAARRAADAERAEGNAPREKLFVSLDVASLAAGLQESGWREEADALLEQAGGNHPVFADILEHEQSARIYPEAADYPPELDTALLGLARSVPAEALADTIEAVHAARERECRRDAVGSPDEAHYLDLVRGSTEWKRVQESCGEHLELARVQRVVNPFLELQYKGFTERMARKPYFAGVNEQVLFHGTCNTDPSLVCLGTEGFDPRCARHGNYGCGTYFSSTPNYSAKHYSYVPRSQQVPPGQQPLRQMVLARVACGNVCDMRNGIAQSLTRPPPLFKGDQRFLYDSVRGGPFYSRSSEMCMLVTYDKTQAMPDYLVTFAFAPTFEAANRPRAVLQQQRLPPPQQQQQQQQQPASRPLPFKVPPMTGSADMPPTLRHLPQLQYQPQKQHLAGPPAMVRETSGSSVASRMKRRVSDLEPAAQEWERVTRFRPDSDPMMPTSPAWLDGS